MKARTPFNAGTELGALVQSWRPKFLCCRGRTAPNRARLERTCVSSLSVSAISTSPNLLCYSLRHYSIYHRIALSTPQLYSSNSDWERSRSQRRQSSRELHTSSVCLSSSRGRLVSRQSSRELHASSVCLSSSRGRLVSRQSSRELHASSVCLSSSRGRLVSRQSSRELHASSVCLSSSRGRLVSQKDAEQFIANLLPTEREVLEKALVKQKIPEDVGDAERPSWLQLRQLSYQHALPFIGFGFLDNAIMITVGEYIDLTIGVALGISTMAAAALGNMISDLAGIGLADQVETVCRRLGLPNPRLTPEQMKHGSTRWMALVGRCAGIAIGCIIGMAPLLWFQNPHKHTATGDYEATDK